MESANLKKASERWTRVTLTPFPPRTSSPALRGCSTFRPGVHLGICWLVQPTPPPRQLCSHRASLSPRNLPGAQVPHRGLSREGRMRQPFLSTRFLTGVLIFHGFATGFHADSRPWELTRPRRVQQTPGGRKDRTRSFCKIPPQTARVPGGTSPGQRTG